MRSRDSEIWSPPDYAILVYLLIVVLLFRSFLYFFNSTIFFNPIGWIDPYWYVGIGLYYDISDFSADYYKISRVPWNILEFLARQTLLPGSAAYVLQTSTAALTSTAIFIYLRDLIGRSKAFVLACLSIFIPLLPNASGGADYHNAFSGGLYFVTMALLVRAILKPSAFLAFCTGAAFTATIHTNPLFILLTPMIALNAFALSLERSRSALFSLCAVSFALAGGVTTTVVLGLVHVMLGREFLFFVPQLEFILWIQKESRNGVYVPLSWDWLRDSRGNAYLLSIFLFCTVELIIMIVQRTIWQNLQSAAAFAGFMITYVIALAYQISGQSTLEPDYFTYVFLVATITPLAYVVNRYFSAAPNGVLVYLGFPLICALSLIFSQSIQNLLTLSTVPPFIEVASISVSIYVIIILLSVTGLSVGMLLLAALNGILVDNVSAYKYDPCQADRHLNVLISTVSKIGTDLAERPKKVFVWFDKNELAHGHQCFEGLNVAYLGVSLEATGYEYLGEPYGATPLSQFTRETFAQVRAVKGIVVLVASNDRMTAQLVEVTAALGIDLRLEGLYQDRASGIKFFFFRPE
jgi:hypothetical protein